MWDDPENARGYAYNLESTAGGGEFGNVPEEDYLEWNDDEDDYSLRDDAPGYDIWKVNVAPYNVELDPESALDAGHSLTPEEAQQQINEEKQEYGSPEMSEGHRWLVREPVKPEHVELHDTMFAHEMTENDYYDQIDAGKRVPDAWHKVPLEEWSQKARDRYLASLRVAAENSNLEWEPGQYGKGWVMDDGSVMTWPIDPESRMPWHMEKHKKMQSQGREPMRIKDADGFTTQTGAFQIDQDGGVHRLGKPLEPEFIEHILNADPRLMNPYGQQDPWRFSRVIPNERWAWRG
jgi:hypothetical protein